jgi:hypothetical protein
VEVLSFGAQVLEREASKVGPWGGKLSANADGSARDSFELIAKEVAVLVAVLLVQGGEVGGRNQFAVVLFGQPSIKENDVVPRADKRPRRMDAAGA